MEINEAHRVVIKLGTSCLFVVDRGNVSDRLLVEWNGNEVVFFVTALT